jgi:hypothetical protein
VEVFLSNSRFCRERSLLGLGLWLLFPALFPSLPASAQETCSARCPDGSMSEIYRCNSNYTPRCLQRRANPPSGIDRRQQEEEERKRKANEADQKGIEAASQGNWRDAANHFLQALEFAPGSPLIRAHLERANQALADERADAEAAAEARLLRQRIEDAVMAANIKAMREKMEVQAAVQRVTAMRDAVAGSSLRWAGAETWKRGEKDVIERLVNGFPDEAVYDTGNLPVGRALKRWIHAHVEFERVSLAGGSVLGVVPGRVKVPDVFFSLRADDQNAAQSNVLLFELGKVLWWQINGDDAHVAQTQTAGDFQKLVDQHSAAMDAMNLAGRNLERLGDYGGDMQSRFAYAVRVGVLNLGPPNGASAKAAADWGKACKAMQKYLLSIPALRP